jgi:hypothetical protein
MYGALNDQLARLALLSTADLDRGLRAFDDI